MHNIGKVIYNKISDIFGTRCYPIIAEKTTSMPFAVYQRESTQTQRTKDGALECEHNVMINIVTEEYDQGISLMEQVIDVLDGFEGEVGGIYVTDTRVDNVSETYNEAYIQTININIITN